MNNFYDNYKDDDLKKDNNLTDQEKLNDDNNLDTLPKSKKIILIVLASLIIVSIVGSLIYMKMSSKEENKQEQNKVEEKKAEKSETVEERKINIINLNDKKRPYGVMINNHHAAWPQSGLSKAYLVYEIMVEGGITRMFALYTQDVNVEKIGSCRSARHNYIDYAQENDAIFVHFGSSNIAEEQFPVFKQDHIDGNYTDSSYFYRDRSLGRSLEHTAFTNSDSIKKAIQKHGFRNERNKDYLLNYISGDVDLSALENNKVANNISIKYSDYQTSRYQYDPQNKYYNRSMGNTKHTDLVTGEQYHFKNIIVYAVKYDTVDKSGHQDLKNVGSGEGYYITNGYAVPITWEKKSRTDQTIYKYKNGKEIDVSDGNTFIQIYPTSGNLTIN